MKERILAWIIVRLLNLWGRTLRVKTDDPEKLASNKPRDPVIFAAWHNRLFLVPLMKLRWNKNWEVRSIVSLSKDGELLARVLECFRMPAIRGSSSKKGVRVAMRAAETLSKGIDLAMTPDGPRGPCYKLQPGAVFLAQQTGARIAIFSWDGSSTIRVKSWDRFMIPKPFSRVTIRVHGYDVKETKTDEEFEQERQRLEQAMLDILEER